MISYLKGAVLYKTASSVMVLWLEKGEMRGIGDTKTMCDEYEKYMKK